VELTGLSICVLAFAFPLGLSLGGGGDICSILLLGYKKALAMSSVSTR
jgi:hypothetical protein|tara:strand:- start:1424 stop:1567 length:144 start_codon:yes stop_codon:yes gene_type:complete